MDTIMNWVNHYPLDWTQTSIIIAGILVIGYFLFKDRMNERKHANSLMSQSQQENLLIRDTTHSLDSVQTQEINKILDLDASKIKKSVVSPRVERPVVAAAKSSDIEEIQLGELDIEESKPNLNNDNIEMNFSDTVMPDINEEDLSAPRKLSQQFNSKIESKELGDFPILNEYVKPLLPERSSMNKYSVWVNWMGKENNSMILRDSFIELQYQWGTKEAAQELKKKLAAQFGNNCAILSVFEIKESIS